MYARKWPSPFYALPCLWIEEQSPNLWTVKETRNSFQGIDSASLCNLSGRYDNPICRNGPPGYIGWRNRFLGSLNVYIFGLRRHNGVRAPIGWGHGAKNKHLYASRYIEYKMYSIFSQPNLNHTRISIFVTSSGHKKLFQIWRRLFPPLDSI